jgi:hypothetical protein
MTRWRGDRAAWCRGLECLDRDVAADLANGRQIEQLAHQKTLVIGKIGHNDFEKIVRLTGDEVARNHLGHLDDRFLERQCVLVGVSADFDGYEDREVQADTIPPQSRSIALDVPFALQTFDAAQARGRRQTDLVRQFDVAQASIGLKGGNNPAIYGIEV